MENKKNLYDFYDKILNCLVLNTRTLVRRNAIKENRNYCIPNFDFKNKEHLLLIEVIKIASMFDGVDEDYPILIYGKNFNYFINFLRLKFKLRKSSIKVKYTNKEYNKNYDLINNLEFVRKELNFPEVVYEEIYDTFYKKGAEVNA